MLKIAVIDDDLVVTNELEGWIKRAVTDVRVDQWLTRDTAVAAVLRENYDLITLDLQFGLDRNVGVEIIKEATRKAPVPVLVVTGMPADLYRGVMKALDAWDYLQKPVGEHDFAQTLLGILRQTQAQRKQGADTLHLDPLKQPKPTWKGKRLNLSSTQQRLLSTLYESRLAEDSTVAYSTLFDSVLSGKNKENIKKQVSQIKAAFREIDADFDCIVVEPLRGYRWVNR